jgi:autotransporter translocation and assembly factor TamB
VELTLFSAKWGDDTLSGSLHAANADLSIVQPLFGAGDAAMLRDVTGRLTADVTARGTPKAKVFGGSIVVAGGSVVVVPTGVTISNINGRVSGATTATGQDSIQFDSFRATTSGRVPGRLLLAGWMKNVFTSEPTFDLAIGADQFHALDRRSIADVYLTTTDSIRLKGSVAAPTLDGVLNVDRTSIYLADRDIARKQTVLFASDDSTSSPSRLGGSAMVSTLMTNLTPRITVTLGNDVRLRSKEANVRLSGDLRVATSTNQSTRTLASTNQLVPRLTLEGALRTEGGTYNLNLGLVQREFQVLSGGTVTFTPVDPPQNPTLDIRAKHDIKQQGGDFGVIVRLHGPLIPYPVIDFSATGIDYEIPTSDLLSYLLTGKPGFDFGQNPQTSQIVTSFLAPTVSAFAADRLRQFLGSGIDVFQFQLGGAGTIDQNASAFSRTNLSQIFYGTTVGAEWQFKNNLFLGVNTGFCQFAESSGPRNPLSNVGAKVVYRFDPKLSMQLAYDPAAINRTCSGGQSLVGLVSPPPNFSFSFSHVWRY